MVDRFWPFDRPYFGLCFVAFCCDFLLYFAFSVAQFVVVLTIIVGISTPLTSIFCFTYSS